MAPLLYPRKERREKPKEVPWVAAARVGCCLLVDVLYGGTILLHNYEMSAFPDIKMRGKGHKKNYVGVPTLPCRQNFADIVVCWRHVGNMSPTFSAKINKSCPSKGRI
jgi:hypothetical protein